MYQVGDLIVYGGTGVCRVMEVGPQTGGRLYYTLEPVYGSCRIFTPVENSKVLMRPIVTRQEAERLIDEIPAIQPEAYYNKVLRELTEHYDTILKTYNCGELLKLTMSIYAKKQEAETQKRRLGAVDGASSTGRRTCSSASWPLLWSWTGSRCSPTLPPGWKPLGVAFPNSRVQIGGADGGISRRIRSLYGLARIRRGFFWCCHCRSRYRML